MPPKRPLRNGRLHMATSDAILFERGSFDPLSYARHVRDNDADVAANRSFGGILRMTPANEIQHTKKKVWRFACPALTGPTGQKPSGVR